jgi:hypothetical protein
VRDPCLPPLPPHQVVDIQGPTRVVGKALSAHALQELALLHIPGAHKVCVWGSCYASLDLMQKASCCKQPASCLPLLPATSLMWLALPPSIACFLLNAPRSTHPRPTSAKLPSRHSLFM